MNRALLAAAAALIVVVGAAAILMRPASNVVGPPGSATPTPTSQTSATKGLVPAELKHNWVGVPHDFPTRSNVQSLTMGFEFGQIHASANFVYGQPSFDSEAFVVGPNTLELKAVSNGCGLGQIGHYRWSLSPGGTLLQLTALDEACPDRSVAYEGSWHAANCKDETDLCWGDLEAGTYPTLFYAPRLDPSASPAPLYGGVRFTVPDGWAVAGDHTSDFRLLRSSDYAREGPDGPTGQPTGIESWIRPTANVQGQGCTAAPEPGIGSSPELVNWLHNRVAGLVTGSPQQITIDGHFGRWIDVSVAPSWTDTCGLGEPTVPLITEAVGAVGPVGTDPYQVSISGQTRMRLIFLDISQPELYVKATAMILITAPDQATFDAFVDQAMPVVQSFHFK